MKVYGSTLLALRGCGWGLISRQKALLLLLNGSFLDTMKYDSHSYVCTYIYFSDMDTKIIQC